MIHNCEASHHAIPSAYPQPRDAEELVKAIDLEIKDRDRVPTPPDGDEYAHMCLLASIGD